MVGFYNDDRGATTTAFLRTRKGRFVDIQVPGAEVTGALKINDRRQVVGLYVDADAQHDPDGAIAPSAIHGFLWHGGDYTTIDVPGAAATFLWASTTAGRWSAPTSMRTVATTASSATSAAPSPPSPRPPAPTRGWRNAARQHQRSRPDRRSCLRRPGRFTRLRAGTRRAHTDRASPDAVFTRPLDIDNRGRIVGDYATRPPVGASSSSSASSDRRAAGTRRMTRLGWCAGPGAGVHARLCGANRSTMLR